MLNETVSTLLDSGLAGGGYLISAIHSHIANTAKNLHEERLMREKNYVRFLNDTNTARKADSFRGKTRRIIALAITFYLFLCFFCALLHVNINYPLEQTFKILGFSYTHTSVKVISGFLYLPWFKQLMFLVAGFYFGRRENYDS